MDFYFWMWAIPAILFFIGFVYLKIRQPSEPQKKKEAEHPTLQTDRDRMISSLALDESSEDLEEIIQSARNAYISIYDALLADNISEEVALFLAQFTITNPYLLRESQMKAVFRLEVLMEKEDTHNEDGTLWNLQLLRGILNTLADHFLKEIGPGFYSYGGYTEGRDFGEKFELIKTLLKGVDVKEKLPDSEPEAITSRLEEEEVWIAEDELFELWIVHTIIREEERLRKEREGGRSIFTHKERDTDREEQELLYDEDYDGAEDEGEVYDDYDNYWDGYDTADVDDLDLDV